MPTTPERPLSPHLQVYRWQVQMLTSILHRATGAFLCAGLLLLMVALISLSQGPEQWDHVRAFSSAWYGQCVVLAFIWSLAYHLCNGVRHLLQDLGHGFSVPEFVRSSWASLIFSVLCTLVVWVLTH